MSEQRSSISRDPTLSMGSCIGGGVDPTPTLSALHARAHRTARARHPHRTARARRPSALHVLAGCDGAGRGAARTAFLQAAMTIFASACKEIAQGCTHASTERHFARLRAALPQWPNCLRRTACSSTVTQNEARGWPTRPGDGRGSGVEVVFLPLPRPRSTSATAARVRCSTPGGGSG